MTGTTTPGQVLADVSEWEVVLPDHRVNRIEDKLSKRWPVLEFADFVTMVQPAKLLTTYDPPRELPEMAVFAIVGPNPRHEGQKLMAYGTASLEDFQSAESEFQHFVGIPDPAEGIFIQVAKAWLQTYTNLKDML